MNVELKPLLDEAFFSSDPQHASEALEQARESYLRGHEREGTSYEVALPAATDEQWLADMLSRLVYYCESTGIDVPGCPGLYVSFFSKDRLHCVDAAKVVQFAETTFNITPEELLARYGTHELHTAVQRS